MARPTKAALCIACVALASVVTTAHGWAWMSNPSGQLPSDMPCGDAAECAVIQELFRQRGEVSRKVTVSDAGYTAATTSANASVAALLQRHLAMMHARLDTGRPINARDPLFAALFAHRGELNVTFTNTSAGVTAHEAGTSPCGVDIVHEHAQIVSGFVSVGMPEMMKTHAVPATCAKKSTGVP